MTAHHVVRYVFDSALFLGIIGATSNGLIALFSILIWRVYRNQLATMKAALRETRKSNKATRTSNKIAKRTLELGRRAWLVTTEIKPVGQEVVAGVQLPCVITVVNAGSTPATNVMPDGFGNVVPGSLIPNLIDWTTPKDEVQSSSVLGGGGQKLYAKIRIRALSETEVAQIKKGEAILFVYLRIEYRDIFKKQRWTTFLLAIRTGFWFVGVRPQTQRLGHCRGKARRNPLLEHIPVGPQRD